MKYENKYGLPAAIVDIIASDYDLSKSDPKRISITTLINPPIQRILQVKYWNDLSEDVSEHIWRILGSSVHYILAKTKQEGRLIEEKITTEIDGITLVGVLDLYDDKTKELNDWKITSVWSIKLGDRESWEKQLNCYAFLLRKCGFEVTKLGVNAIIKDWRKGECKKYNDYPPVPFQKVNIKLWSFEEQEKFVKERIEIYKQALALPESKLPICSDKDRWKKEDTYAIYKGSNKTATRVLNSKPDAELWLETANARETKENYRIEERKGIDMKCTEYCLVCDYCPYYIENYKK